MIKYQNRINPASLCLVAFCNIDFFLFYLRNAGGLIAVNKVIVLFVLVV